MIKTNDKLSQLLVFCVVVFCLTLRTTTAIADHHHLKVRPANCDHASLVKKKEDVLPCYLMQPEPDTRLLSQSQSSHTVKHDAGQTEVTITHVKFQSLKWQPENQTNPDDKAIIDFPIWEHRLTIYRPHNQQYNKALLYIADGSNHPLKPLLKAEPKQINSALAKAAARTQSVVIELNYIPNQPLTINGLQMEDNKLMGYSWLAFLLSPDTRYHWPIQLPMVKATTLAMDTCETILQEQGVSLTGFVLTGGSKRGWVASLVATLDKRVSAIITYVADLMNLQKETEHFFKVYPKGTVDVAPLLPLKPLVNRPETQELWTIIDPYQRKELLDMPKFMVSTSSDEIIPPDSTEFFFNDLPDEKWLRTLPGIGHKVLEHSFEKVLANTEAFFGAFVQNRTLPKITWELNDKTLVVNSSVKPKMARFWQVTNSQARDFRLIKSNTTLSPYSSSDVTFCKHDDKYQSSTVLPNLPGWTASFVEMHFPNEPFADLVFTTRVFVTPDTYITSEQ